MLTVAMAARCLRALSLVLTRLFRTEKIATILIGAWRFLLRRWVSA